MSDTKACVKKMVNSLVKSNGYPYAAGYLESFLVEILDKHVKDKTELEMIKIRMLDIGINQLLDKMEA